MQRIKAVHMFLKENYDIQDVVVEANRMGKMISGENAQWWFVE